MAQYHFHAYDNDVPHEHQTRDFDDLAMTRKAAISFTSQKLPAIGDAVFKGDFRLDVTDDRGLILMSIMVLATDMTAVRKA